MLDVGDLVRISEYQNIFNDWAREAWKNKTPFLIVGLSWGIPPGIWVVKLNDLNGRRFFLREHQLKKIEQ